MLGFDIETTGLIPDIPTAEISVVCTIDSDTMEEVVYNFMKADFLEKQKLRTALIQAFDNVDRLCAYNAVLFDIPFMQKQLELSHETVDSWLQKLCDPFHSMKMCFGVTCKLDKMLAFNGLECKSATGLQAIEMAKNGEWQALIDYCMDDVRLTVQLCALREIKLFEDTDKVVVCLSYADQMIRFYCTHPVPVIQSPQSPDIVHSGNMEGSVTKHLLY